MNGMNTTDSQIVLGTNRRNHVCPVETKLHIVVCSGQVTLAAGQHASVTDWTTLLDMLINAGLPLRTDREAALAMTMRGGR